MKTYPINLEKRKEPVALKKAYYWYRSHPYFGEFYPGKVLNAINDPKILRKYPYAMDIKRFFPYNFGPHGLSMLYEYKTEDTFWSYMPITELIFELVRQLHFSDAPSRFSSLYASETLEQAEMWNENFSKTFAHSSRKGQRAESLWEIEYETNARIYDAKFLDVPPEDGVSIYMYLEHAYQYWYGRHTLSPLLELLIPYPVVVSRLIRNIDTM